MLMSKEQLAMNLCYLVQEDYELLNVIISDYVMNKINNKEFNDWEDVVNIEMKSIVWGLYHYFKVLRGVAKPTKLCYN